MAAVLAGLLPINAVADLTNIGVLLAFVVVCAAVLVLRYTKPHLKRGFRCPGMPVVPVLGMVFSVWLMSFLHWETWVRMGAGSSRACSSTRCTATAAPGASCRAARWISTPSTP
ncbi:amino acid permease [Streptomyces sp. NPDC007983]|uniref:amino acid permease n=1 Tax=Streptomyces sp. NPDC007983 TaxID=3364800 RepID=UPI0036E28434